MGIWDTLQGYAGPTAHQSSGLNDLWSPGGSDTSSFTGLDPNALAQWNQLFSGYTGGIAPWQMAGFNQAVDQASTKFSAANAARGGMNPFTTPQIASSAAQYVAPQFAALNTQALNNLLGMRQISTGNTMSRGPGLKYQNQTSANSNWWNMWNSIGSSWGGRPGSGMGGGGGGVR